MLIQHREMNLSMSSALPQGPAPVRVELWRENQFSGSTFAVSATCLDTHAHAYLATGIGHVGALGAMKPKGARFQHWESVM